MYHYQDLRDRTIAPVQTAQIQELRDKNVGVVKDNFSLQLYTRFHSFKYEFSKNFWGAPLAPPKPLPT